MHSLRAAALLLGKDLRVEWRTREILSLMVFFAVLVVLVFSFSFLTGGRTSGDATSGILWTSVAFSGTLGLNRSADRERENDVLTALLLVPSPRVALYLAKLGAIVLFMAVTETVVLLLGSVLFGLPLLGHLGSLIGLFGLGTLGFGAVGALFALLLGRAHARDVLLAVLLYPIILPIMIAGTRGTAALLEDIPDLEAVHFWIRFLAAFDAIFLVLALWVFELLLEERG